MNSDSTFSVANVGLPTWSSGSAGSDTLVHVVRHWARQQPSTVAYLYVADGTERALTFGELDRRATAIASALRAQQAPGTTALMLHPLGLDFVEAFFGCLYAGVIAVPLHPGRGKSATARLRGVVGDCEPRSVLTTSALAAGLRALASSGEALEGLPTLATDALAAEGSGDGVSARAASDAFEPAASSVAFLQYTSGSTSKPKGTMVTHRNIMANQEMLRSVFRTDRSTVIASWLPVFHDMGLIGNVLHAAYLGVPAVLLSTLGFIKSPISWLRAIARYRATFSGAPNFAYDLCVAKTTPEERAGLDLSSWRVAFNGAEPVRERTLEAFAEAFEPHGFARSAFVPTYGLAEATLVVSGSGGSEPAYLRADARLLKDGVVAPTLHPTGSQVLVSVGRWDHGDQEVLIVDPEARVPCASGQVGEIWISGSHVAAGYWRNEAATRETFGAVCTEGASSAGGQPGGGAVHTGRRFLRTGDLGFAGESGLFITGRMKDLIIFRGQNIYPQDIELTVELAAPELRAGCTAAFSVDAVDHAATGAGAHSGAPTGVVVVAELEQRASASPELLEQVARRVQEQHELPLERLVLVRRNSVPKTTSGKIQRRKCKDDLLRGALPIVGSWTSPASAPSGELRARVIEHAVAWIARHERIERERVDIAAPIARYGLDSIEKVELVHTLEEAFGVSIPEASFFAFETVDDLVRAVVSGPDAAASSDAAPASRPPSAPARPPSKPASGRGPVALPAFSAMTWEVRGG
jgi:acyl-CoA synthetase (AMP-forming)/AMP-acid ligase II/acyl carrier protein